MSDINKLHKCNDCLSFHTSARWQGDSSRAVQSAIPQDALLVLLTHIGHKYTVHTCCGMSQWVWQVAKRANSLEVMVCGAEFSIFISVFILLAIIVCSCTLYITGLTFCLLNDDIFDWIRGLYITSIKYPSGYFIDYIILQMIGLLKRG